MTTRAHDSRITIFTLTSIAALAIASPVHAHGPGIGTALGVLAGLPLAFLVQVIAGVVMLKERRGTFLLVTLCGAAALAVLGMVVSVLLLPAGVAAMLLPTVVLLVLDKTHRRRTLLTFGAALVPAAILAGGMFLLDTRYGSTTTCANDSDCATGEYCNTGYCWNAQCAVHTDCNFGAVCEANLCRSRACTSNADCPEGTVCQESACSASTAARDQAAAQR